MVFKLFWTVDAYLVYLFTPLKIRMIINRSKHIFSDIQLAIMCTERLESEIMTSSNFMHEYPNKKKFMTM